MTSLGDDVNPYPSGVLHSHRSSFEITTVPVEQLWRSWVNKSHESKTTYFPTSNISCTLVGNKIVDHSDVVGASTLIQLHLHSRLNTWLHCIGQKTTWFGATYIRGLAGIIYPRQNNTQQYICICNEIYCTLSLLLHSTHPFLIPWQAVVKRWRNKWIYRLLSYKLSRSGYLPYCLEIKVEPLLVE